MIAARIICRWLLPGCLLVITSACSQQQVHLQTLYSANDCALQEPTLMQVHSSSELKAILGSNPANFMQSAPVLPEVDYEKQSLVLYALGQKPTAGYSIDLYSDAADIKQQTLYLPVRIKQPAAGDAQAQVITSPCQVYVLPHADFADILIADEVAD